MRLNPAYAEAHNGLGLALCRKGRPADGIREFQEALRLRPNYTNAWENLATALAVNTNAPSLPPQHRPD